MVELARNSLEPANHQRTGMLECIDAVSCVFLTLDRIRLLRSLPTQRLRDVEYQGLGMDVLLYRMGVNRKRRGQGKPETFTFLGFTFSCGKSRQGKFVLWRKTRAGCNESQTGGDQRANVKTNA